ncbi:MAG: NADH-quinone oxidoreductase subunit NuoE [Armatimonadota bacterium]|nr:NADH-quinone oxidoreductase subunit NuoE [Armatimonadota bacterium]
MNTARTTTPRLSEAALAEIRRLVGLYEHRQSALLPALFVAQHEYGYLPPEALEGVARALDLPISEVASVASFYSLFYLEPVGRHVIQVCTNLSCMINGCGAVVQRLQQRLGVGPGQTTPDGRFTLRTVECLAACDEAPAVIVDEDRWARVGPDDVDAILARYS